MTADAAAALLGTSPVTLSLWEERFGYPVPERSADGERRYCEQMMIALRDALTREVSIASAITEARRVQPARWDARGRPTTPPRRIAISLENSKEAQ